MPIYSLLNWNDLNIHFDFCFRLIINDCLDSGSQLPFIKKAIEEGYGVLVLNTNLNTINGQKIRVSIPSRSLPTNTHNKDFTLEEVYLFFNWLA